MKKPYEQVSIDRVGTDGRVARITLNRPEKLNALTPRMMGELDSALRDLEADASARVIILRGAGRAFSVGHDMSGGNVRVDVHDPERRFAIRDEEGRPLTFNYGVNLGKGAAVQMFLWRVAKVTVVQTHGYCLAGGMEFAMMGDLVTTSKDCLFGHPGHRALGVARNAMILPMVMGMRKAKELFFTGDAIDGTEAERLGLVNYAWEADALEEKTIALADRIANQSADFLGTLKLAINRFYENMGIDSSVSTATHLDAAIQQTESAYAFRQVLAEQGLKAALQYRDAPYGDYGAAKKA